MSAELPTFEDVDNKPEDMRTPLEQFIHDYDEAGFEQSERFRVSLRAAIISAVNDHGIVSATVGAGIEVQF